MSGNDSQEQLELSAFELGTILVRRRWRWTCWVVAGAALSVTTFVGKPPIYEATASFAPQGAKDAGRGGLAALAGQLGVSISSGNQSPDFYASLLTLPSLLERAVQDTFVVAELGGKRMAFDELFEIEGPNQERRVQQGEAVLADVISPTVTQITGVVQFTVRTKWRSVSLALAEKILDGVNQFNDRARQTSAGAERRFVEGRIAVANDELRVAEGRLSHFVSTNRQLSGTNAPDLVVERGRLERDVALHQSVYMSLKQSYEDNKLREVWDTPVITIVQPPWASTSPTPRGRVFRLVMGLLLGTVAGAIVILASEIVSRRKKSGDPSAREFVEALHAARDQLLSILSLGRRGGSR